MAGELARPIANFPDDFQILTFHLPIIGTGGALTDQGWPLWVPDDDVVIDSGRVCVTGISTVGVAIGTATTVTLFKTPITTRPHSGVGGTNAVAITDALTITAGTNSSFPFVLAATSGVPTANQVSAGMTIGLAVTTSGSTGTANTLVDRWTVQIRYHTKRAFVGGSDALKKVG